LSTDAQSEKFDSVRQRQQVRKFSLGSLNLLHIATFHIMREPRTIRVITV
jgi:hypothetical protein